MGPHRFNMGLYLLQFFNFWQIAQIISLVILRTSIIWFLIIVKGIGGDRHGDFDIFGIYWLRFYLIFFYCRQSLSCLKLLNCLYFEVCLKQAPGPFFIFIIFREPFGWQFFHLLYGWYLPLWLLLLFRTNFNLTVEGVPMTGEVLLGLYPW